MKRNLAPLLFVLAFSAFFLPLHRALAQSSSNTAVVASTTTVATNDAAADKAWRAVFRATQSPMPSSAWQTNEPTKQEVAEYYRTAALKGADKAKEFYTQYPNHPKAPEAHKAEYNLIILAVEKFGDTNNLARLVVLSEDRLNAPDVTPDEKYQIKLRKMARLVAALPQNFDEFKTNLDALKKEFPDRPETKVLEREAMAAASPEQVAVFVQETKNRLEDPGLADAAKLEMRLSLAEALAQKLPASAGDFMAVVEGLMKDYPDRPEVSQLMMEALMNSTPEKGAPLVAKILESNAPEEIKQRARGIQHGWDALGKPLDMKFTAFDGSDVDLAKMKGKVILIDFWATWCGPCVAELPNVKAAYDKYHDQGFEIIGISLDEDKDALTKFLKKEKTPWPEYFDGLQWKNKYALEYGINSIPAMWLIDKKGLLNSMNVRGRLDQVIPELLGK